MKKFGSLQPWLEWILSQMRELRNFVTLFSLLCMVCPPCRRMLTRQHGRRGRCSWLHLFQKPAFIIHLGAIVWFSKMNTSIFCTYKAYNGWPYILQKGSVPILKQICFGYGFVYHPWKCVPTKTDVEAVCPEGEPRSLVSHAGATWTLGSLGTRAAQSEGLA